MTRIFVLCGSLAATGLLRAQTDQPPDAAAQKSILDRVRQAAPDYNRGLPDFVCTQDTRCTEDRSGTGEHWKQAGTIEEKLTYFSGRESYNPVKVYGKTTKPSHTDIKGFRSDGLFGGRRLPVFTYRVAQEHSHMRIGINGKTTVTAFHGLIHADRVAGTVMRVRAEADLPQDFPVQSSIFEVQFGPATISGQGHVAPVTAEDSVRDGRTNNRNVIEFARYHKFVADSAVSLDGAASPDPKGEVKK